MIKDAMADNAETTPNSRELAVLKEHFPGYFRKDGAFDVARFSDEVLRANGASPSQEGFGLDFLGRNYAKLIASLETETVVVPDAAHNSLPENQDSRNLYITGDNLDALKHLLKSYSGQVKCIYIDPPYNTGGDDFVYNDAFNFSAEEIERKLGIDEEQARKLISFTSKGSSSHSAWLTFMYPRLQLAKSLLANDGVIFISIDDNEIAQLRLLCDSVFGEERFLAELIWKSRQNKDNRSVTGVSVDHEYVLAYGDGLSGSKRKQEDYTNPDNDPRGPWASANMVGLATVDKRPNLHYELINPETGLKYECPYMGWRYGRATMDAMICDKRIIWPASPSGRPRKKAFLSDMVLQTTGYSSLVGKDIFTRDGTADIVTLFNERIMDFPKPVSLVMELLSQASLGEDDFVVDFFSGSATTAHAVMQANLADEGSRRFIMVQWDEACKGNSEALKAGYKTIDEIGRERIKRAAKKIREENPLFAGDLGFKHYTLKPVPKDTLDKLETFDPDALVEDASILEAFGRDTVLETWLVKDGYGFGADARAVKLKNYTAYWCGRHLYLIEPGFTQDDVAELFKRYDTEGAFSPDHVVLFGYSFAAWSVREMLEINLRQLKDGAKNLQINIDTRY